MEIKDAVFIVTGGASGLGAACVAMLREQGAQVIIADLQEEQGMAEASRSGAQFVRCDVCDEGDAQQLVDVAATRGILRGLINCAGVAPAEKVVGREGPHSLALFRRTIEVNLIGSFNMSRLVAQAMSQTTPMSTGERGVIIHTASVAAFDGQIGQAAYSASKAGITGMTLPMARELAKFGVRVMTIAPGIFETPMLLNMSSEVQQALGKTVPFPQRLGKPAEFAALVKAIVENPMLNGETIRLDGALRMAPK